jgi:hypothetical protein
VSLSSVTLPSSSQVVVVSGGMSDYMFYKIDWSNGGELIWIQRVVLESGGGEILVCFVFYDLFFCFCLCHIFFLLPFFSFLFHIFIF